MAQRGGSVVSHVRWGERVDSPLIAAGEVDYLIAFEQLEALRYASLVRPGGIVLVNDYRIAPVSVSSGNDVYPDPAAEEQAYGDSLQRFLVPAIEIAQRMGQARVNNIVMLGALSHFLPAPVEVWLEVISGRVPERTIALNRDAFAAGRAYMQK